MFVKSSLNAAVGRTSVTVLLTITDAGKTFGINSPVRHVADPLLFNSESSNLDTSDESQSSITYNNFFVIRFRNH